MVQHVLPKKSGSTLCSTWLLFQLNYEENTAMQMSTDVIQSQAIYMREKKCEDL